MEGDEKLKRFRLVSIYVGNFGCFHDQTFNFCSDYTIKREPDHDGKLCLRVTHEKVLPDNFFSLPQTDNSDDKTSSASQTDGTQKTPSDISCVDSISAIIGKNGTGKSTLARLLCNLPHDDSKTKAENDRWNVVVVYECDGALYGYSTKGKNYVSVVDRDGKDICLDSRGILLGNSENAAVAPVPDKPCYRLFYYSPHYTTEQSDWTFSTNGDNVTNISTAWLMRHPVGNSELLLRPSDKSSGETVKPQDIKSDTEAQESPDEKTAVGGEKTPLSLDITHLSVFEGDEMIRVFEFLSEYKNKLEAKKFRRSDYEIPLPSGMTMSVRIDGLMQALSQLARAPENGAMLAGIKEFISDFKAVNGDAFLALAFVAYALQYILHNGVMSVTISGITYSNSYLEKIIEFLSADIWKNKYPSGDDIVKFFSDFRPGIYVNPPKDEIGFAALLFSNLLKLKDESKERSGTVKYSPLFKEFHLQFGDEQLQKKVFEIIRLHSVARGVGVPFLKFDPLPRMSSGQMSFISLFARLYQFVTKPGDGIERPVVIFLDEAETTLHPEWQQRLVSYLIRFLNVFMPERRYQLIFASHSPTLLSDIPKGNCVFLQWSEKNDKNGLPINESVPFTVKDGECENTFGANIYDLYHNAFFLEHGAIGEFAEEKIQDALKAVKKAATTELVGDKNAPLDKEIDLLMNLVGDRIVHRYFQRLKEFGLITERA